MSKAFVSVVMPVRNGGDYLAAAVASIIEQDYPAFELILVDDHSTDRAIERLQLSDSRVAICTSPGHGVVSAFNHGLKQARGDFIARMDADDISMPARLSAQLEYLVETPGVSIAGACVEIISTERLKGGNLYYQQWLNSVRTTGEVHRQLFIESPIPNPTAMFRRDALLKLGGYRDVDWPEDYDLFLRADAMGMRMGKPRPVLLQWREHETRLTRTDQRYSRARFQQAKAHFLAAHRLPEGPLIIWGGGPGGRQFHDLLKAEGREVCGFIDVHPRRIGGFKRDKPVWDSTRPESWQDGFILVAVGSRGVRREICNFLDATGRRQGEDFLFVM